MVKSIFECLFIVFLFANILHLEGSAEDDCLIIRLFYLHLQYNSFIIYNELKPVLQRPSHDKVPLKNAANGQTNTSHRSMIPRMLVLVNFVEITPRQFSKNTLLREIA